MPRDITFSRPLRAAVLVFVACGATDLGAAEQERRPPTQEELTANVVRIETGEAPTIDGDLSDAVWAKATVIDNLKQRQPDYLAEPTERTFPASMAASISAR